MSAEVSLNLFNKLWKSDKMGGLLSILSLFAQHVYKFNNKGVQMLDSFLSYDIKITLKLHFWCEKVKFLSLCTQHC